MYQKRNRFRLIHKEFIGTKSAIALNGKILANCIVDIVYGIGINFGNCVGQGYEAPLL